ncbi:MAG TPA: hypothetical protein VF629_00160 [Hymenobacter sp.]|jgi:hypothetical protein|uniref:hypothetical protein n=1 Tax=Hymenobacter sp. TaxID=1898978 RepID=UPI002ED7A5C4
MFTPEIYNHCTKGEDIKRLEDLCSHCPIPAEVEAASKRIKAEIASRKETDTPSMFLRYCEESLERHSKLAAKLANDLNNPIKNWYPQTMGAKFWNQEVAKLYRDELSSLEANAAPSNPFGMPPELYALVLQMQEQQRHEALMQSVEAKPAKRSVKKANKVASDALEGLLRQIDKATFEALLLREGMLTLENEKLAAAPSNTPGAWVALGWALKETGLLRENGFASLRRALVQQYGAKVSEKAMQEGPGIRVERRYNEFVTALKGLK